MFNISKMQGDWFGMRLLAPGAPFSLSLKDEQFWAKQAFGKQGGVMWQG